MDNADQIILARGRDRTAGGSDDTLTVFVQEHSRFVYRVAYFILRNPDDSQDVVQETFVRVMKNIGQLPLVRDQRAWVGQIAWRLALNRRKKLKRINQAEVVGFAGDLRHVLSRHGLAADNEELIGILERLIASLPEDLRNPLVLSAIEEMSSAEVSKILGIPGSTVRTRALRARKLLREKLRAIIGGAYEA